MPPVLFCRACGNWFTIHGGNVPEQCPHCQAMDGFDTEPLKHAWVLTENDKRLLKAIKIKPV